MVWKIIFVVSLYFDALHSYGILPQAPCSPFFQYLYKDDITEGQIRIPPPQGYAKITIKLEMLVNTRLKTEYYGRLDLLERVNDAVSRLQRGDSQPLRFRVSFPVQNPVPVLVSLKVNGRDICTQNPSE
jgi:Serine protease gd N-terminus